MRALVRRNWTRWALVGGLAICGCGPGPPVEEAPRMTSPSRPIADVLAEAAPRLMSLKGVTAVGQSALADGSPCISVYVLRRDPELERQIPDRVEGYPVVIRVSGEIQALPDSGTGN